MIEPTRDQARTGTNPMPTLPRRTSTWPSLRLALALALQGVEGWTGRPSRLYVRGAWRQLMSTPRRNRHTRRVARCSLAMDAAELAFIAAAHVGELGERYQDAADTAVTSAIEHDRPHDTHWIAEALRALAEPDAHA